MQTPTIVSLNLTDVSSSKGLADSKAAISYGEFYQVIASGLLRSVYTKQALHDLGNKLVVLAEHAYAFRQMEALQQVSQVLVKAPLARQCETVGKYYQALCIRRLGAGDVEQANRSLEHAAENAPLRYRVRAMISLAGNSVLKGENQSAISLYSEAARLISINRLYDPYAAVHIQKMVAVISSEDGDHRGAVALLENLLPLAHSMRAAQPHVYYDYLNSLAVELCEVGRLEEARNASRIALASPFAVAYPEWRETREEIELRGYRASRSAVALNQTSVLARKGSDARNQASQRTIAGNAEVAVTPEVPEANNLVTLPTARRDSTAALPSAESQPLARVIEFPSRTSSMTEENDKELDAGQKRRFVADRLYEMFMDALDDKEVDVELVEKLYKVYIEKRKKG